MVEANLSYETGTRSTRCCVARSSAMLDDAALARSLTFLGDARPFIRKLDAGRPVSLGLLGASVGQEGGCIAQRGKRCLTWSGCLPEWRPANRSWRPGKKCRLADQRRGWFVRLLDTINETWPSASHRLLNGASDAVPAQTFHQCLLSHLPPSPDLILLEFGSMARHLHLQATEALVRRLLALPSSPHLVFLTVRELCPTAHLGFGHPVPDYAPQQKTVHSWAEASFEKLARHYGQSSLSYYHAIAPLFHANATNFTRADVAADCLHPSKGRRGSGYMASMLTNWLRAARRDAAAATREPARQSDALPPPLHAKLSMEKYTSSDDHCFGFAPHAAMHTPPIWGTHVSAPSTAAWDTDACPPLPPPPPPPSRRCKAARSRHCISLRRRSNSSSLAQCGACPVGEGRPNATLDAIPKGWFFCDHALVRRGDLFVRGKISPGVLSLRPGATLDMRVPPAEVSRANPCLHKSKDARLRLHYLTSYEHMGAAQLSCVGSCACEERRVEALNAEGRASVFEGLELAAHGSLHNCTLRARLLGDSGSVGKFKIARLMVSRVCAQR